MIFSFGNQPLLYATSSGEPTSKPCLFCKLSIKLLAFTNELAVPASNQINPLPSNLFLSKFLFW